MKVFLDFVRFRWKELNCVEILRASCRAARSDAAGQLRRSYKADRNHLLGFEAWHQAPTL